MEQNELINLVQFLKDLPEGMLNLIPTEPTPEITKRWARCSAEDRDRTLQALQTLECDLRKQGQNRKARACRNLREHLQQLTEEAA